jgi:Flp pilus assembly protein TadG
MKIDKQQRRGAAVVESAIVLPILITVLLAIIVGAFAVFIHQETASLAREGARYASVHGDYYAQSQATPAATPADVYNNAIAPKMVGMDPANLTYDVSWSPDKRPGSFVTVTVTYQLSVPIYGDLTLSSTSTEEVHW